MRLDTALVHRQRGILDRPVPPPQDAVGTRLAQMPIAQFGNGHLLAGAACPLGRVFAGGDPAQLPAATPA